MNNQQIDITTLLALVFTMTFTSLVMTLSSLNYHMRLKASLQEQVRSSLALLLPFAMACLLTSIPVFWLTDIRLLREVARVSLLVLGFSLFFQMLFLPSALHFARKVVERIAGKYFRGGGVFSRNKKRYGNRLSDLSMNASCGS